RCEQVALEEDVERSNDVVDVRAHDAAILRVVERAWVVVDVRALRPDDRVNGRDRAKRIEPAGRLGIDPERVLRRALRSPSAYDGEGLGGERAGDGSAERARRAEDDRAATGRSAMRRERRRRGRNGARRKRRRRRGGGYRKSGNGCRSEGRRRRRARAK